MSHLVLLSLYIDFNFVPTNITIMKTNPVLQAYRDTLKKLYVAQERAGPKKVDQSNKKIRMIEQEIDEVLQIIGHLEKEK